MKKMVMLFLVALFLGACSVDLAREPNNTGGDEMVQVEIKTNKGVIVTEIYKEKAPITAGNFLKLVGEGFYDGLTFHRYVEGFVIQGGDPKGDGTGGTEENIQLEIIPGLKHDPMVLSMARTADPNSASSQFFITLAATPHLDGQYAIFGRVVSGDDVVLSLREGDTMETVRVK